MRGRGRSIATQTIVHARDTLMLVFADEQCKQAKPLPNPEVAK
jgi:hypothetical protein